MSEKKVSMSKISELRERTGAGVVDCKKALQDSSGDLKQAINFLRKKGIASAVKKSGKVATKGATTALVSSDSRYGAVFELNSQTDFVSKNVKFQDFVKEIGNACLVGKPKDLEELKQLKLSGSNQTILDKVIALSSEVGEKVDLRKFFALKAEKAEEQVAFYTHPIGFTVSVLVLYQGENREAARNLAMHIAAANPAPEFISAEEIPAEKREKELQIEKLREDLIGKSEKVIESIVKGRVEKKLSESTLEEQWYVKQPDLKIKDYCKQTKTVVSRFIRLNLGEGIEKKESSFSEEVAAQTKAL